jgi:hypothetical protein
MMMQTKLSSEMKAYIHQTKEHHISDYSNLVVHYYLQNAVTCPPKGNIHVHIFQINYLKASFVTFHKLLCRVLPDMTPAREVD